MDTELYFLRSSEAKIVENMLELAHEKNEKNIKIYTEFYGLKPTDLGLYALHKGTLAGAIWSREIDNKATLSMAMKEEFRNKGIGSMMMEQFLLEAATLFDEIIINSYKETNLGFYKKFGFIQENSSKFMMIKKLEKREIIRPKDGYDASRWMD